MKKLTITIDQKFIEESLREDNFSNITLDQEEIQNRIKEMVKEKAKDLISDVVRQELVSVVKKDMRKLLRQKITSFLDSMSSSELFFREEFRHHMVSVAKENNVLIDKKIKAFLTTDPDAYRQIVDAIGSSMTDRFFEAIENGKLNQ